jgi:hypothetical protein
MSNSYCDSKCYTVFVTGPSTSDVHLNALQQDLNKSSEIEGSLGLRKNDTQCGFRDEREPNGEPQMIRLLQLLKYNIQSSFRLEIWSIARDITLRGEGWCFERKIMSRWEDYVMLADIHLAGVHLTWYHLISVLYRQRAMYKGIAEEEYSVNEWWNGNISFWQRLRMQLRRQKHHRWQFRIRCVKQYTETFRRHPSNQKLYSNRDNYYPSRHHVFHYGQLADIWLHLYRLT